MDCREAKDLFVAHILGDLSDDSTQSRGLELHLGFCRSCRAEYESNERTVAFVEAHKADFAAALESVESGAYQQRALERSWRGIEAKLDRLEAEGRRQRRDKMRRILVRISAAAACLAIGAFMWLALLDSSRPKEQAVQREASAPAPSIRIALLSETGKVAVASGQTVSTSDGELKKLVVNDRHRLVMNSNSTVAIEPLMENGRLGCKVNLDSGQIYASVEHNGEPFIVATAHGRAVITGTTFDVRTTESGTTLVVADGRVRFESEKGVEEIAAGQISEIFANSAPMRPRSCDAAKLTAWAMGHEFKTALAKLDPHSDQYDPTDLWLSASSGSIELESINYEAWIEEKRPWFERQFPWIFQLQAALKAEGIETDYPKLLISSDDIWQFAYPATSPWKVPITCLEPMLKAASRYGFDKQWLMENVPAARSAVDSSSAPEGRLTNSGALEAWAGRFAKMRKSTEPPDSTVLLYSLHASVYLANTRTLVWLSLMNGKHSLPAEDKAQVLDLLQAEVNTASELAERIIRLFVASENQPCDEYQELLRDIIHRISIVAYFENELIHSQKRMRVTRR